MNSKPVVAIVVPPHIAPKMFSEADLRASANWCRLVGPISGTELDRHAADLARATVLVSGWGTPRLDADLIARLPHLKFVAHSAGSVKGIVTEALFDQGVRVITAAGCNAKPVADYTVAMMVGMLKQVYWLAAAMARGDQAEIQRRAAVARELEDIDVGLIAASRVGREVIHLLKGYRGVRIKVYDPYLPAEVAGRLGVELCSLEEACRCPVVSLHAPNIPATRHMINARTLALMPDHAVFINTSRGALVDEAALVAEVRRRPLYACLDVTDPEPPPAASPLRKEPNILLTPHVAGSMSQACRTMGRFALEQARRFLAGEPIQDEVTRQMLATQA